jgi:hypothetical protein
MEQDRQTAVQKETNTVIFEVSRDRLLRQKPEAEFHLDAVA